MKIILFILHTVLWFKNILLKVNIGEITPLKTEKEISPLKRSGLDCTCANTDYFITRF